MTWDFDTVANSRCNAFKHSNETLICSLGVVGSFAGDFDDWSVPPKPGINVLDGCLPKSKSLIYLQSKNFEFQLKYIKILLICVKAKLMRSNRL